MYIIGEVGVGKWVREKVFFLFFFFFFFFYLFYKMVKLRNGVDIPVLERRAHYEGVSLIVVVEYILYFRGKRIVN